MQEIYQFRALGEKIGTAGQPAADQFAAIRQAGFEAVVNLALPASDGAVPNEGAIVTGLGMAYAHVPVDFKSPTARDFAAFCGIMDAFAGRSVFVHCAANMRVSAFMYLYRTLRQQVSKAEAERDLLAIWRPDEVWQRFIDERVRESSIG